MCVIFSSSLIFFFVIVVLGCKQRFFSWVISHSAVPAHVANSSKPVRNACLICSISSYPGKKRSSKNQKLGHYWNYNRYFICFILVRPAIPQISQANYAQFFSIPRSNIPSNVLRRRTSLERVPRYDPAASENCTPEWRYPSKNRQAILERGFQFRFCIHYMEHR